MPTELGSFDELTEAFAAAAVDPARWEAAMDVASGATGSFGAMLLPLRTLTPGLQKSASFGEVVEDYVGKGWIERDERAAAIATVLRRRVCSDFDFTTSDGMARSPCSRDLLGRHRLKWFACVKMGEGEEVWGLVFGEQACKDRFRRTSSDVLRDCRAVLRALRRWRTHLAGRVSKPRSRLSTRAELRSQRSTDRRSPPAQCHGRASAWADLQVVKKRFVSFNRDATAALDRTLHALIWANRAAFQPPGVLARRRRPMIAYPSRLPAEALIGLTACVRFVV